MILATVIVVVYADDSCTVKLNCSLTRPTCELNDINLSARSMICEHKMEDSIRYLALRNNVRPKHGKHKAHTPEHFEQQAPPLPVKKLDDVFDKVRRKRKERSSAPA